MCVGRVCSLGAITHAVRGGLLRLPEQLVVHTGAVHQRIHHPILGFPRKLRHRAWCSRPVLAGLVIAPLAAWRVAQALQLHADALTVPVQERDPQLAHGVTEAQEEADVLGQA